MQLADLIQGLNAKSIQGSVDREITGVRYDSRRVTPGNLFVAVRGAAFDGHSFIEQAIDKGAVAVVGEQAALSQRATAIVVQDSREALAQLGATFFGNPSRKLKMIGVTGTNGKSTTTFLIKHLLERAGQSTGLIGTVQYEIGERLLPAPRTTPESLDLQELLSQCVEAGCRNVVIEVSSHALKSGSIQRNRVCGRRFHQFDAGPSGFSSRNEGLLRSKGALVREPAAKRKQGSKSSH